MSEAISAPAGAELDPAVVGPEDFEDFERWRESGELPGEEKETATPEGGTPEGEVETDPDSDPDTAKKSQEGDEEQPDQPGSKKKGGFQRKIEKVTEENRALQARLAALEERLAGEKPAGDKKPDPDPEASAGAADGRPLPEDFDTYEDYVEKLTEWKLEQREAARAAAESEKQAVQAWQSKLTEAATRYEDFQETVEQDIPLTPAMQQALMDSDKAGDLCYWLGKHPEEAERIAKLSPVSAVRELGKIEASLSDPSEPAKPKSKAASAAPPPPKPVGGGSGKAVSLTDPDTDYEAWERRREQDLARRSGY